ncbi:hypothetical protein K432DRAFT_405093 [Lepidopterella palustris CBS 459.81]|uniref:Uncharacterized protein n=1 Tax=Lepidopterella palustris CBS 459.81 TaxID=1314670 RepID=A0A8E2E9M2_9PEZI|nr:hypothetical protein K432DRAFT_405093 [Lepidopterella palustris CBS 459.81]
MNTAGGLKAADTLDTPHAFDMSTFANISAGYIKKLKATAGERRTATQLFGDLFSQAVTDEDVTTLIHLADGRAARNGNPRNSIALAPRDSTWTGFDTASQGNCSMEEGDSDSRPTPPTYVFLCVNVHSRPIRDYHRSKVADFQEWGRGGPLHAHIDRIWA